MSIMKLPIEILENSLNSIDDPSDLLALTLACKSLSALIIPENLEYQIIQCGPGDAPVWQQMAEHPLLAMRV
ncbi:hypothetical protein M422DRAFT_186878 [Sphaerobolus stellatus SS14]|uniref:F-box domain-containing protein n=1 Tax=Sphaerobolus stellatus (strain SS14) TaxID=990650 RepID=A0A0C9UZ02_SPHS4|nr:hypothetical protein M422DRAFT_186878 [Sphaerobolus stellatus SS14]